LGLIIDVLIAYVIKLIVRLGRARGSSNWRLVTATIATSRFDDNWGWNCPTVHIAYTYQLDGETYSGQDSKPFLFSRLGEEGAECFKPGETAKVRVDPHEPERSVLRRADQANLVKAAE
jgi:hypothetical protein